MAEHEGVVARWTHGAAAWAQLVPVMAKMCVFIKVISFFPLIHSPGETPMPGCSV